MKKTVEPEFIEKYRKEEVLELGKRSLTSVIAHFFVFVFLVCVTPLNNDYPMIAIAFGVIIFINSAFRMFVGKKIPSSYDNSPQVWNMMLSIANYISALLWGVLAYIMGELYSTEWPFLCILIINCGLSSGSTSSLAPRISLARNFIIITLLPVSVWGFIEGSSISIGISLLTIFTQLLLMKMAKENYLWYWDSIKSNEKILEQGKKIKGVFKVVLENASDLNLSSKDLSDFAGLMNQNATDMSDKLKDVVQFAKQVNTNSDSILSVMKNSTESFNNIAIMTEEMTSTIDNIAKNSGTTCSITQKALTQSEVANQNMKELGETTEAITSIVETIAEISYKINLLALNATIEAARAGEAGKGFAVVATEIKELAVQTSESTDQIKNQVNQIQTSTTKSSDEILNIAEIFKEANQSVTDIAAAVEQQSTAFNEVSHNLTEVSDGFIEVNRMLGENNENMENVFINISEVDSSADDVKDGSNVIEKSGEKLLSLANELDELVTSASDED